MRKEVLILMFFCFCINCTNKTPIATIVDLGLYDPTWECGQKRKYLKDYLHALGKMKDSKIKDEKSDIFDECYLDYAKYCH